MFSNMYLRVYNQGFGRVGRVVWKELIPIALCRTILVSCDDNAVCPVLFLSEDKETKAFWKVTLVLNILAEIGTILGKNGTRGEENGVAFFIEGDINFSTDRSIKKVFVGTCIKSIIELWVWVALRGVDILPLANCLFPEDREGIFAFFDIGISCTHAHSNVVE